VELKTENPPNMRIMAKPREARRVLIIQKYKNTNTDERN
jgi:hypothetical protein